MPIEINLGDFGTIHIERRKSRRELLVNLSEDRAAIEKAIRKYAKNKEVVSGGDHIGDENFVPVKILIASSNQGKYDIYPTIHKLFIDLEGKLIEEDSVTFPDGEKGGMSNVERDPRYLPYWFTEAISEVDLKTRIDEIFYSEEIKKAK